MVKGLCSKGKVLLTYSVGLSHLTKLQHSTTSFSSFTMNIESRWVSDKHTMSVF